MLFIVFRSRVFPAWVLSTWLEFLIVCNIPLWFFLELCLCVAKGISSRGLEIGVMSSLSLFNCFVLLFIRNVSNSS